MILRLLAIFHFVVAGLAVAGIGFLFLHYSLMNAVFSNPQMWQAAKPNFAHRLCPRSFLAVFKWFYVIGGISLVLAAVGNVLSGLFRRRKHRVFSIVIAALDCLQIPFWDRARCLHYCRPGS